MQLYSGSPFYPADPRPEEIDIVDIAHSLSNQCRFNGHTMIFYSVAEHSVLVSRLLPDHLKLQGLLHDASEAYIGDLIRPVKYQMIEHWNAWEDPIFKAIAKAFGLPEKLDPLVKQADMLALAIEQRDVMVPTSKVDWGNMQRIPEEVTYKALGYAPHEAETLFLKHYDELINGK